MNNDHTPYQQTPAWEQQKILLEPKHKSSYSTTQDYRNIPAKFAEDWTIIII